jgi:hypothetical protein
MTTEWDLFIECLPEELKTLIVEGTEGMELPAKDHPLFEILRQAFTAWLEKLEGLPEVSDDSEEADPESHSQPVSEKNEPDIATVQYIAEINTMVGRTASLASQNAEKCNQAAERLHKTLADVDLSSVKNLPQTIEEVIAPLRSLRWKIPWLVSSVASFALVGIFGAWAITSYANTLERDKLHEFRQIKGITDQNFDTLHQLGELKVALTVVPDVKNHQYYLNLQNVAEITSQTDIPNGKAVIFTTR